MNLTDEQILTHYIEHEASKSALFKGDLEGAINEYNKHRDIFRDSYSFQMYLVKYKINKLRKDIKEALRWW